MDTQKFSTEKKVLSMQNQVNFLLQKDWSQNTKKSKIMSKKTSINHQSK